MSATTYRRRLPHIFLPGHVLFLTFRLASGQREMLSESERTAVVAHLRRMNPGLLSAFVVMPDHVHLLYQMAAEEDMIKTLKAVKGCSARTLHVAFGRQPPIWQDESYDHVVRTEDELQETWTYIEHNPVRRGLVASAGDYPWSSAGGQECPPHGEGCGADTPAVARTLLLWRGHSCCGADTPVREGKDDGGQECPPHGARGFVARTLLLWRGHSCPRGRMMMAGKSARPTERKGQD